MITHSVSIRLLAPSDLPQALGLSSGAGWNQLQEDWSAVLELAPNSAFAIDCDGELAATATLICYSQRLAWLGMVLTKPTFQRRGFARLLVRHVLRFADAHGIQTVKLDATQQGQPLYESLGFVAERSIERWSGNGPQQAIPQPPAWKADWSAIPRDQHRLLKLLAHRALPIGVGDEFVLHRPGLRATYLGPCFARTPERAAQLIESALAQTQGPWLWDLFPENASAVSLASLLGFRCARQLVRMSRGLPLREDISTLSAIAGFEFG